MTTRGLLLAGLLALLVAGAPARADLEAGYRAFEAGDIAGARIAWEAAAAAGEAEALHNLGVLHDMGDGSTDDPAQAAVWYRRAVEAGIPESAFNLGNLYREGRGVEQDLRRAIELYWQAGQAGHPGALNNLGAMFLAGMGVEEDPTAAAELFAMAAEAGSVRGLVSLARLIEEGHGVERDILEAVRLYRIAAGFDDPLAVQHLPTLRGPLEATFPAGGDSRALTRQVQAFLTALGYDPGPIDGAMGPRTGEAIAAFERDQGLAAAGRPTAELRARLIEALLTPAPPAG
jgi:TPR repeat protein